MPEKEKYGAYILPIFYEKTGDDCIKGSYKVSIGKFDKRNLAPEEMFTTNPAISKRIESILNEETNKGKINTGFIDFYTEPDSKKVIRLGAHFPFSFMPMKMIAQRDWLLMKLGLASRIELRMLMDLKKRFPGYKIITPQHTATILRKEQLKKRGSYQEGIFKTPAEFQEEILKIAKYIGSHAPSVIRRRGK